ncbi:MAG: hypothetical protein KC912_14335 [Proteobacteria bacterium]|nr:hypothetical protein [Pseudomonadota bacterium]
MSPETPAAVAAVAPADALVQLEALGGSLEPYLRARALALRVRQPDGLDWAGRGLYDPEPWVQMAVIDAMASRSDGASVLDAWVAGEHDPFARAAGAVVLGVQASEATQQALGEALGSGPSWSRAPIALAGVAVGVEGAEEVLAGELRAGTIPLELRFIADVARVGHGDVLVAAMAEGSARIEPEISPAWAASRLVLGDFGGLQAVRAGLAASDDEERLAVIDALMAVDTTAADGALKRVSVGTEMVAQSATCVRVRQGSVALRKLIPVVSSEVEEVRALAMRCAVAVADDPRNRVLLERILLVGLADESAEVRLEAARAVQKAPFEQALPYLQVLARDDDRGVQVEALGALLALSQ